jgi:hypothetical protein
MRMASLADASPERVSATLSVIIASVLITAMPAASMAQIPSFDDYAVGSGTVVVNKKTADVYSSDSFSTTASEFSISNLKGIMKKVGPEVKSELWGDVANNMRAVDGEIGSKNLGYSSFANMIDKLSLDSSEGKNVESIREDLAFSVKQLKDLALSKRVLFFNKDDLEIMKKDGLVNDKVAKEADPAAVEEALGYLKDIDALLNDLEGALSKR